MNSRNVFPLCECIFFAILIYLICRIFSEDKSLLTIFYVTYWVSIVLILIYWIILCLLNLHRVFGVEVLTSYNAIRKSIQKNRKAVVGLFIFFQLLNNVLFGTLGYFNMEMGYNNNLDVVCITVLFVACWEYFNYYKLFRLEVLKKVSTLLNGVHAYLWRGILVLVETAILLYQIVISLYFVLLTNQSVRHNTLNCYMKLLFVLFIFKVLGSSCQKYLKKLLLCASLFALIAYDWFVFVTVVVENEESDTYFDFFIVIFVFTHGFFLLCSYTLYKEWNLYRHDQRRPRLSAAMMMRANADGHIKVGLTDDEIRTLKFEILESSFQNGEKLACTICTFDINKGDEILKITCGHIFHSKCIIPWLQINKACPNCRTDLIMPQNNNNNENIGLHREEVSNEV